MAAALCDNHVQPPSATWLCLNRREYHALPSLVFYCCAAQNRESNASQERDYNCTISYITLQKVRYFYLNDFSWEANFINLYSKLFNLHCKFLLGQYLNATIFPQLFNHSSFNTSLMPFKLKDYLKLIQGSYLLLLNSWRLLDFRLILENYRWFDIFKKKEKCSNKDTRKSKTLLILHIELNYNFTMIVLIN